MKLIRFGDKGSEKPGIQLDNGARKDVSGLVRDFDGDFFRSGGLAKLAGAVRDGGAGLPNVNAAARTASCVPRPGKIIGIGLNYRDHAIESGLPIPEEPVVFMKATTSLSGPNDQVVIPKGSVKTDWEVELGMVIGADARYLGSVADAKAHIAGYCVINDVSERAFQIERGGQWDKGKSCDTFTPVGPWLVTADEVGDPQALKMRLRVNGEKRQSGSSSTMIFACDHIVWYLSQFMTLEAGDIITTGTPPGVGLGMKPPQYLKAGDIMDLEIEKLGSQRQHCVAWSAAAARA
ncbi:MAG: fumarylacetoacetate hydrolase family protein [Planctomycetes bacterium]|nr:fumarylacetoacetate hydrolase family protein [Planctomycetota bacterium]